MRMLCIDPGKSYCGWAYFKDKKLVEAGVMHGPPEKCAYYLGDAFRHQNGVDVFVGELTLHRGERERARFNEGIVPLIVMMSCICGAVIGANTTVMMPSPIDWKGNTDGDTFIASIRKRLRPAEREVLIEAVDEGRIKKNELEHAMDAAGLGLWALGRRA